MLILFKEIIVELKNYLIARLLYSLLLIIFRLTIKGNFIITTIPMTDSSIRYLNPRKYPRGTVLYIKKLSSFTQVWNGYCSLIVAIDLKNKEQVSMDLIPNVNCIVVPRNSLSNLLYGEDQNDL
jgi:hypothetical protein